MSDPLLAPWLVFGGASLAVGSAVGSFLNVVAYRLPRGRNLAHPPSACPHCGSAIRPWHNVPVLGWLMLRGRCADCADPIAARYPLVEAGCGLLWGLLFLTLMPTPETVLEPARLLVGGLFGVYFSALLAASLIDADHFILPDSITLPLIPLGIAVNAVLHGLGIGGLPLHSAVFGAVAGAGVMVGLTLVGRLMYGREAMGLGDAKLVAAVGAWQGLHPTLIVTVFAASLLGSVVGIALIAAGRRERASKLPFGPYLAAGALIAFVAGERLWALAGLPA